MQGVTEFRKILPVLKKVCNSFDDKMNTEFAQVMFLLMMQQPWYQYIKVKDGFSKGKEVSSKVSYCLFVTCLERFKQNLVYGSVFDWCVYR